jgi:antitoxin component YwqK of YwqJK toxin-antitoxin module
LKQAFIVALLFYFLQSCTDQFNGNGIKTVYFKDSKKIFQTVEYKNGKKNGLLKEYYKNGHLKAVQHFTNDTLTDTSLFYHENGKLSNVQLMVKNKKQGCWKKYNKDGNLYSEINFKDGVLDGESVIYTYKSGRVLKRINYKEGSKHGKQETFYNSGKPESISYYNYDNPCLGTEEWDESGKKIKNDFKIIVEEQNKILMENSLKFLIHLENLKEDDVVYQMNEKDTGRIVTPVHRLPKKDNYFLLEFYVGRGSFIMEKIKIAAFRKTTKENIMVKTATIIASSNNF